MLRLSPGRSARIIYPAKNYFAVPLEFVRRSIEVVQVIDSPVIDAEQFLRFPFVRRGATLVLARDLDADGCPEKTFWAEAMSRTGRLPFYRFGLYDPDAPGELVDWLGRPYAPTTQDRWAMKAAARWYMELVANRCSGELKLAAFPVRSRR